MSNKKKKKKKKKKSSHHLQNIFGQKLMNENDLN